MHAADLGDESDIIVPAVQFINPDGTPQSAPALLAERDILQMNYIIVSALIRRDLFMKAGGFRWELPYYEDWDLFLRLILQRGAKVTFCPQAVVKVHDRPLSRNKVNQKDALEMIKRIQADHFYEIRAKPDAQGGEYGTESKSSSAGSR
jgi:GT2 family glycosyltransferase